MDFTRKTGLFSAPFPGDDHPGAQGFPTRRVDLVEKAVQIAGGGFATSAGVFFTLSAPLAEARLPDLAGSAGADATVFLMDTATLRRTPIDVTFRADGGLFGAPNLLALLPLQGVPLRPNTLYAAVVLRAAQSPPLGVSLSMAKLAAGEAPAGLADSTSYRKALEALKAAGVRLADVAALAAFTTGDPRAEILRYRSGAPLPALVQPFSPREVFDEYCVYAATLGMPDYQQGTPPYASEGGGWATAALHTEEANLVVTIPKSPMPTGGYPTAVFVRTGGGGDRPLVDRGPRASPGGPAIAPGTGPALHFARAGFAGVSVDGPLGGRRNPNGGDEQFLIFNVTNPIALRDNIRQSALELSLLPPVLDALTVDASNCGLGTVRFDTGKLALMGHSMGATIAPLVLYAEPRYRAVVLSGAGGSWIENVMWKEKPLPVRPLAELLLGYPPGALRADDPVLSLVQWAAEPADPQVYAPGLPQHVLMVQGIVDHYILPRIANGISLALGLDFAGQELDGSVPGQTPISDVISLAGGHLRSLPASGAQRTAVVVQQAEDGVEDGHEVVFQTGPPKHMYRCFLQDLAQSTGAPKVRAPGAADAPCD